MAYITTETVAKIRKALKAEFPNVKFSVRKHDYSVVNVSVMKSTLFEDNAEFDVNHYWLKNSGDYTEEQRKFLIKVDEIIRKEGDYYDNSDSMTDYFDTAFYYHISVGKWDKPHQKA